MSRRLSKADFETLARFRYALRRFLRFSEEVTHSHGVTPLQYALMLQIRGFPGRDWASVAELAERLQAKHHGVVSLVTRCEAAGWVRRVASRGDRRLVEVHLTRRATNASSVWLACIATSCNRPAPGSPCPACRRSTPGRKRPQRHERLPPFPRGSSPAWPRPSSRRHPMRSSSPIAKA